MDFKFEDRRAKSLRGGKAAQKVLSQGGHNKPGYNGMAVIDMDADRAAGRYEELRRAWIEDRLEKLRTRRAGPKGRP